MALTGGEIRLDRSHDGRVAYLTLDHGKLQHHHLGDPPGDGRPVRARSTRTGTSRSS